MAGVAEFVRAGMTVLPPGREAVTASPALINLCGADQLGEIVTDVAGVAEFVRAGMTALRRATRR